VASRPQSPGDFSGAPAQNAAELICLGGPMPEDLMRYDLLAQEALRGVVRAALKKVIDGRGLPGEHHFYIAFNTKHPGVQISERLHKKYAREMTIVIQHQFWNLAVTDIGFQVELSFDNIPEKLIVPFAAVKGFLDPYVQFGLQFETVNIEPAAQDAPSALPAPGEAAAEDDGAKEEGPKVVSLDAFRKKP
jgi:hypothetical protein